MTHLKLAIIGAGPSSFYVASRLLSLFPQGSASSQLRVHMYDRLWAPHGLVRYGVAPDHPEVKNCTHKFDQTATDSRFRFFGNINIGENPSSLIPHTVHLPLPSLLSHYTHLLFASGCTVPILHPALPPSRRTVPALSLVHWYTQHPSRPPPPALDTVSHVTLIGQGNVSLDIARMLLTSPSILEKYDVPEPVLEVLRRSTVKHVSIVGRRGPLQAAFTMKELREMMNLTEASMFPLDASLLTPPVETKLTRQQSRTLQLLEKGSAHKYGTTHKTWSLDFFRSPTGLFPPMPNSASSQLALAHTALDSSERAVHTGATSTLDTDLVITSLGQHADPSQAFYDAALGHLRARGVLASTMLDAYAVTDTILSDHFPGDMQTTSATHVPSEGVEYGREIMSTDVDLESLPREVEDGIRTHEVTEYGQWKTIDAEEVRRGEARGKERERMGWEEAQQFLRSKAS
ncbi:hypothetical protein EW146_g4809 [Bondarzewia mesenterica]|uniref:NADPH:adrenodoxin oxidoreductase, mitochondrial n=1 Tax=Bondarzewia mesenterica TaxID=1095465 RepID=A0A4S4LVI2_9AGAM|nr:hypothetical protein EW146_g4809 [Bondarzewia mesenterica]